MSEDWTAVAADVLAGLSEVGTTGYILRAGTPTGPSYNQVPGTPTQHACTVVYSQWGASHIDGTLIRASDRKLLVGVLDIVPEIGDAFWDGVSMNGADKATLEIVPPMNRTAVAGSGSEVLYVLNVRG